MRNRYINWLVLSLAICLLISPGLLAAEEKQDLKLAADELVIDDSNGEVIAIGNVQFERGKIRLTADKLNGQEELTKIEADGNVIIKQLKRRLSAQHLEFNNQTGKGTLTGEPKYEGQGVLLQGNRFDFNLETGKLVVQADVYLEDKDAAMRAEAKKLVYYQAKNEALLIGDVIAHRGERRMTAQKMRINLATNQIKAEGRSTLIVPNAGEKQGDSSGDSSN